MTKDIIARLLLGMNRIIFKQERYIEKHFLALAC